MQEEQELIQHNDLIQRLQSLITTYLNKNSSLTLNALSQRANVPVTSLRRLASGQQKNEIAPHSVLNITSYILKEKNLNRLISKTDPVISDFLKRHFGNFIFSEETQATLDIDLNLELRDQIKYFIYKLAANHNGTDWISIVESFGAIGKKKAEELKFIGLLIEENNRLHARNKNFSLELSIAASHLPDLVGFYSPEKIYQGHNSFFSLSESLTPGAIQEIKKAQRECVTQIHKIMSNPDNFGDIAYFTVNLSETFASESFIGELQ